MLVPQLETPRLILRGVTEADVPAYERHFVDYAVIAHLSAQVPWPYPAGGVAEHLRRVQALPDRWLWGLFLKTNPDELIGAVDLWRQGIPEHRGFWLGRTFWGRGLMTEAVAPVMDHAFDALGFERLVFANAVGNTRSRRIKEKTGAVFVGVDPAAFVDPQYTEHEVWALTRAAWAAYRAG